MRTWLVV